MDATRNVFGCLSHLCRRFRCRAFCAAGMQLDGACRSCRSFLLLAFQPTRAASALAREDGSLVLRPCPSELPGHWFPLARKQCPEWAWMRASRRHGPGQDDPGHLSATVPEAVPRLKAKGHRLGLLLIFSLFQARFQLTDEKCSSGSFGTQPWGLLGRSHGGIVFYSYFRLAAACNTEGVQGAAKLAYFHQRPSCYKSLRNRTMPISLCREAACLARLYCAHGTYFFCLPGCSYASESLSFLSRPEIHRGRTRRSVQPDFRSFLGVLVQPLSKPIQRLHGN